MTLDVQQIVLGIGGICLTGFLGAIGWMIKKIWTDVEETKIDVGVIKTNVTMALKIGDDVKEHGKEIVRLQEADKGMKKDINALHDAKRELYQRIGGKS